MLLHDFTDRPEAGILNAKKRHYDYETVASKTLVLNGSQHGRKNEYTRVTRY